MKSAGKIVSLKTLAQKVRGLKNKGKKIAFTNGCFDVVHFGHISYLEQAKKDNRVLIVGVNSDASTRRIKGPERPIVGEKERASLLAALSAVDFVTIFTEDTPIKVIETLKPDILIKGADWKNKPVVGADVVRKNGGKVEFIKYLKSYSTTNIIESILKRCPR